MIARTRPNAIPPLRGFSVKVSTRAHSASSGDDYRNFSRWVTFSGGFGNWVDVGNAYESEVQVAVRIVGDHLDENDETFGLLLSAGNDPLTQIAVAPADLEAASRCTSDGCESLLTIVDDDTRGLTASESDTLTVTEGGTASYTVVLDSKPTDDVTVTPEVADDAGADISVSAAVTFTPRDWDVPQTVTVTAEVGDDAAEGSARITHTVAGGDYGANQVAAPSVAVTTQERRPDPGCITADCDNTITFIDEDLDSSQDTEEPEDTEPIVDVTIDAKHPTALQGIDDVVFTITRSVELESELDVPVTLSSGIIDADRLSHTVTIGANETSAELSVHTRTLDPAATTGDVTAIVADSEEYDAPEPATASVRVYVGDPLVTVRFDAASYTLDESVGETTDHINLIARTEPDVPAPAAAFVVAMSIEPDTASAPHDYEALSTLISFPGSSAGAWDADGDAFVAKVRVLVAIVDDDQPEGDETLRLVQEQSPGVSPEFVGLAGVW